MEPVNLYYYAVFGEGIENHEYKVALGELKHDELQALSSWVKIHDIADSKIFHLALTGRPCCIDRGMLPEIQDALYLLMSQADERFLSVLDDVLINAFDCSGGHVVIYEEPQPSVSLATHHKEIGAYDKLSPNDNLPAVSMEEMEAMGLAFDGEFELIGVNDYDEHLLRASSEWLQKLIQFFSFISEKEGEIARLFEVYQQENNTMVKKLNKYKQEKSMPAQLAAEDIATLSMQFFGVESTFYDFHTQENNDSE